jgi:hypothetical protein
MRNNRRNGQLQAIRESILNWMDSWELTTCKLEVDACIPRGNVIIKSHKIIEEDGKTIRITEILSN